MSFRIRWCCEGDNEREQSESEVLGITGMFIDTCLSYWSDVMGGGSYVRTLDDVPEPCVWRGLSNSKSRCLEAIQRELVRQNVLPDMLDVPESSFGTGEQWWQS